MNFNNFKPKPLSDMFSRNKEEYTNYGVIFNEYDKSMERVGPVTKEFEEPKTESLGILGTVKRMKSKKEQDEMIKWGKTLGYTEQ